MNFPTLYKRSSTGAMQVWSISVAQDSDHSTAATIITEFGQENGAIQNSVDTVTKGKNVGKKNETTPYQQACSEAQSKWTKQITKKGYVESRDAAWNGEKLFKGGAEVMLAHKYWVPETREIEQGRKIKYPAAAQPKLDGHRCNAKIVEGVCTLWSRGHEPITGVPHIVKALEEMFPGQTLDLDGELYNHDYHDNFEELSGFITSETPKPGHEVVEYHVYDLICDEPFATRMVLLAQRLTGRHAKIIPVETVIVHTHEEMVVLFESYLERNYEGLMLRNLMGKYLGKRSYDLQKVKTMDDNEYLIVGVEEGRGKMAGKAIFVCVRKLDDGTTVTFNAKKKGSLKELKAILERAGDYIGKTLTVQHQGYYKSSGIPRFAVAKAVREAGF